MLTIRNVFALLVVCFLAGQARAQDQATGSGVPVRIVVTVEGQKDAAPPSLTRNDVLVYLDNQRMRVTDWTPVQNDRIGLQLWILIDDGTDTALGTQLEDLRRFVLEQRSLYPALHRMDEAGWIRSEWAPSDNNRRARYYRITAAGRRQLAQEETEWLRAADAITRVLRLA